MEDQIMQMLQSLSYQLEKQDEALSLLEAEQNILASKAIKQVESSQVSVLDRVKDISSSSALASDILSSVKSSIPQSNKLCKSLPSVVSQSQLWSQSRLRSQSKSYSRSSLSCFKCKGSHTMRYCEEFRALQPQERMKFVNQRRICSCCLSSKCHPWQKCPTIRTCNLNGCDEKHHRMLHRRYSGSSVSDSRVASNSEAEQSVASVGKVESHGRRLNSFMNTHEVDTEQALFKVVPVRLKGKKGNVIETYAFLDDGSSLTLIDDSLVESLGLSGDYEELELQWTRGIKRKEKSLRTRINISGVTGEFDTLSNVYALKNLDLPVQSNNVAQLKSKFRHLRGLPIPSLENAVPKILIGIRHSKYLVPVQSFVGQHDDPVACHTHFGWTVFGVSNPSFGKSSTPDVHLSINKVERSEVAAPEVRSVKVNVETKVAKGSRSRRKVGKKLKSKVEVGRSTESRKSDLNQVEIDELLRILFQTKEMSVEFQIVILNEIKSRFDSEGSSKVAKFKGVVEVVEKCRSSSSLKPANVAKCKMKEVAREQRMSPRIPPTVVACKEVVPNVLSSSIVSTSDGPRDVVMDKRTTSLK